jgi:peptide/nickel transport system substrate-binding protein
MSARALTLLLALAVCLPACPKKPKKGPAVQTLRIHTESEPAHLVSLLRPDAWAHRITAHNLFESLVRMDPRTYEFKGELASTWKRSADSLTYTFYLRHGVKWHDGKPFTGEDVKFTFDRIMDEQVRAASVRATLEPFIASYRLVKPDRFEIVCKRPSPWFLVNIADVSILPAHLMRKGDLNKHPLLRKPVGTGPYKFKRWDTGRRIELERFDDYWGTKPRIGRLSYRIIQNPETAIKLARRRELDFVSRIRAAQWTTVVQKDPVLRHEFIHVKNTSPGTNYVLFNHRRKLFKDARVRRALAHLLDVRMITKKILHGLGRPIGALYWFKDPHHAKALEPVRFDPEGAARLLRDAGWTDSDKNGVLDKDDEPFRFVFLLVAASKTHRRWLTIYQQELRKAGIVMEISPIDWAAYLDRIRKHDFDMGALGMVQVGPFTDLYLQFHSSQIDDGQNYGAYSNPRADALLERIRTEMDPKRREKLSQEVQALLYREMPVIPLFSLVDPGIVSRRVHGVYSSALWYQVRDWWIE